MNHKKWSADTWAMMSFNDLMAEHNDLFDAWRKAETRVMETLDENNRLDRELDEARQAIKALESRPVLTWEECEEALLSMYHIGAVKSPTKFESWLKSRLPAPIRGPFSDEQIEAMAKAHMGGISPCANWEHADKQYYMNAQRAALAAGGLVPCAVPERASDEELEHVFEQGREFGALLNMEGVRAVRARVEAPLLAEIERLKLEDGHQRALDEMHLRYNVESERDTLKARVAELEAGKAGWCERDRGNPLLEMAELREKMGAVKEELTALRPWLRQPTGWELDVTPNEAMRAYCETYHEGAQKDWQAVLDLCRSRIRPTFECAECAKVKAERDAFCRSWDDCRNRLCVIRNLCAALEGE